MSDARLYAIVLRLRALRPGAISLDHGDKALAALFRTVQAGDPALAKRLHDANTSKPYSVGLAHGGVRGKDGAQHFGEGDSADWRFTLLAEPAFQALLERYLKDRSLPHVRLGAVPFAVTEVFASGNNHPDSGHTTIEQLHERWQIAPENVPDHLTLDFLTPTAFSLGQNKVTKAYRIRSLPDPKTVFSALRKKWIKLGGRAPDDAFDEWTQRYVEAEPLSLRFQSAYVENRRLTGFVGRVSFRAYDDTRWLPFLHLLADAAFWTGVGYQTTSGMGQTRRVAVPASEAAP
jgi:CRISPR-associated endoribonuclease Cas6